MRIYLGQAAPTGTLRYDPVTKAIGRSANDIAAVRLYVNGALWAEGGPESHWDVIPDEWVRPLKFELLGYGPGVEGPILATLTVTGNETTSVASPPPGGARGSVPPLATVPPPVPGASWFEQSTDIFGVQIPNLALVAGGGLLALAVIRKRG